MPSMQISPLVMGTSGTFTRTVGQREYGDAEWLTIQAPESLQALTRTLQVSCDGVLFGTLVNAANVAVTLPAQGTAITYRDLLGVVAWRIGYNLAPSAAETWFVSKQTRS